jgi:ferredoxin
MPVPRHRPENTPGNFYVTSECIGCGLCVVYAPDSFKWNAEGTRCYVARQPRDVLELDAVWDAIVVCPVACIRHDGDAQHRRARNGRTGAGSRAGRRRS